MFKNALISVSDKSGLIDFVKPLAAKGMRVVSTGGTAQFLEAAGVAVVPISEQTGFPEVMDGRVKTLHPKVHMALLGRDWIEQDNNLMAEYGIDYFDLVIGNLYPFEQALQRSASDDEQIEFIDIGGPSFLRSAAKNFNRITVLCDPSDYSWVKEKSELTREDKRKLSAKVFAHTSSYDSMIARYLAPEEEREKAFSDWSRGGELVKELRYGENPHQTAHWYRDKGSDSGWHQAEVLQGKELSYNNLLDLEGAIGTLREFGSEFPVCVSVKHCNPCGVGIGQSLSEAVASSLKADPVSVFGGIIAMNEEVDEASAEALSSLFLECIVAPRFSPAAKSVFSKKSNLRLLEWPQLLKKESISQVKSISGGYLVQQKNSSSKDWSMDWKLIGATPDMETKKALILSWKVCANLKSNAIAITNSTMSLGLGMGQVNRVDAVDQAILRMKSFHPMAKNAVLASDAFFPFPDSIDKIANAGIKWVIQPGGSIKDSEVIARAEELGVNLVLTGQRNFLH